MATLMTLFFRPFVILSGILLLALSILIYRKTKDATKGWFYLSMFGISLFLWSGSAMLLRGPDLFFARTISGTVFLLCIAFFVLYSFTKLADDLWIEKPLWINSINSLYSVAGVFLLLLLYNLFSFRHDFASLLPKILSISHQTLAISFILTTIPTFYLWKKSKEWKWGTAFLAVLLAGMALNFGQYYDGCCGPNGDMETDLACADYDLDYMRVHGVPCQEGLVGIFKYYQLLLILSLVFVDISFYLILRSL